MDILFDEELSRELLKPKLHRPSIIGKFMREVIYEIDIEKNYLKKDFDTVELFLSKPTDWGKYLGMALKKEGRIKEISFFRWCYKNLKFSLTIVGVVSEKEPHLLRIVPEKYQEIQINN